MAPGALVQVPLTVDPADRVITVLAVLRRDASWALAGHLAAAGSLVRPRRELPPADSTSGAVPALPSRRRAAAAATPYVAIGALELDVRTGTPHALTGAAGRVLLRDWTADVWRAPIDNERAFVRGGTESRWRELGLDRMRQRLVSLEVMDGAVQAVHQLAAAGQRCGFTTTTQWRQRGADAVAFTWDIEPYGGWPADLPLPRLGLTWSLNGAFEQVSWRGYGPGERYPDTGRGELFGDWTASVAAWQTPYVYPQENGNRAGVEAARLSGPGMPDVALKRLSSSDPGGAGLAVRPWSSAELDRATHRTQLRPDGRTWITLSAAVRGIGSAACGPGVLAQHELMLGAARLAGTLGLESSAR